MAAAHLARMGFDIVGRNVRVPGGELDIVARRGRLLVVCEVRARSNDTHLSPVDTLGPAKQNRVRASTIRWMSQHDLDTSELRFDAASVVFDTPGGRMEYYEGAF